MSSVRALTLRDVAREIGRSTDWLARNWAAEVRERGMPAPIHEKGGLVWSAPGFYAWLDRDLSPALRASATAYRAALVAASNPDMVDDEVETWRAKLNEMFGSVPGVTL